MKTIETISLDDAWTATQNALQDLHFTTAEKKKSARSAQVRARSIRERPIQITLKKQAEDLTEIGIRVGIFGDEVTSHLILNKIKDRF